MAEKYSWARTKTILLNCEHSWRNYNKTHIYIFTKMNSHYWMTTTIIAPAQNILRSNYFPEEQCNTGFECAEHWGDTIISSGSPSLQLGENGVHDFFLIKMGPVATNRGTDNGFRRKQINDLKGLDVSWLWPLQAQNWQIIFKDVLLASLLKTRPSTAPSLLQGGFCHLQK